MAFENQLLITEIFHSLQGETSLTGIPFAFVRLTGCNLRCTYCDSSYSFKGGKRMTFDAVLSEVRRHSVKHVLMTGGEPLLQRGTLPFIKRLTSEGYNVSIETHGEASIQEVSPLARIILDIKTPGSKMQRGGFQENLKHLKPTDEVKFVITSTEDYEWAKTIVHQNIIPTREILFSPAVTSQGAPGTIEGIHPRALAEKILKDQLQVRFQIQLHKYLWGADTKGV